MASKMEGVSARSLKLMKGPLSYINVFLRASTDLWADGNPEGWIPLVVAENKLGNDLVLEKLEAVRDYPLWTMNYNGMKGVSQLQQALARLMEHTFVKGVALDPEMLCISSGCSAIIDNMFYILCDDGDGVLIPAPYYPAFDNDLTAKNHLHPLPFFLRENQPIAAQLDAAVAEAASRGIPVRALLVTNPNNPLGTVYSEETVGAMLQWCLEHKVHYVSDEIYACSIFKPGAPFVSGLTLAQQLVGEPSTGAAEPSAAADGSADGSVAAVVGGGGSGAPAAEEAGEGGAAQQQNGGSRRGFTQWEVDTYVHLIYGLSKDWCASGLRVGVLYSRNKPLQQAMNSVALFSSVSNYVQHGLAEALGDLEWADAFLSTNRGLLEKSYDTLAGALSSAGIPFLPAEGGMFVWIDLRQWLPAPTWEGEQQLWDSICETSKVILTPGDSCHAEEPGYFRLCFAWMPPQALAVAVDRLAKHLKGGS